MDDFIMPRWPPPARQRSSSGRRRGSIEVSEVKPTSEGFCASGWPYESVFSTPIFTQDAYCCDGWRERGSNYKKYFESESSLHQQFFKSLKVDSVATGRASSLSVRGDMEIDNVYLPSEHTDHGQGTRESNRQLMEFKSLSDSSRRRTLLDPVEVIPRADNTDTTPGPRVGMFRRSSTRYMKSKPNVGHHPRLEEEHCILGESTQWNVLTDVDPECGRATSTQKLEVCESGRVHDRSSVGNVNLSTVIRKNLSQAARKSKQGTKADPVALYQRRQQLEARRVNAMNRRRRSTPGVYG
ncbi:unnamed protein product [Choristocarpus tenellus]